jgi:hypothetical protein
LADIRFNLPYLLENCGIQVGSKWSKREALTSPDSLFGIFRESVSGPQVVFKETCLLRAEGAKTGRFEQSDNFDYSVMFGQGTLGSKEQSQQICRGCAGCVSLLVAIWRLAHLHHRYKGEAIR